MTAIETASGIWGSLSWQGLTGAAIVQTDPDLGLAATDFVAIGEDGRTFNFSAHSIWFHLSSQDLEATTVRDGS